VLVDRVDVGTPVEQVGHQFRMTMSGGNRECGTALSMAVELMVSSSKI
jgi:hypothetical protein